MIIFGSIVIFIMTTIFILGGLSTLRKKTYKYLLPLGLLILGISFMGVAMLPHSAESFKTLIFTLTAFVFFILAGILGGVAYIFISLKKNK